MCRKWAIETHTVTRIRVSSLEAINEVAELPHPQDWTAKVDKASFCSLFRKFRLPRILTRITTLFRAPTGCSAQCRANDYHTDGFGDKRQAAHKSFRRLRLHRRCHRAPGCRHMSGDEYVRGKIGDAILPPITYHTSK